MHSMDRSPSVTKSEHRLTIATRCRLLGLGALTLLTLLGCSSANAASASGARAVNYRGFRVRVPASWPVYDLTSHPTVCVRFDRHAVYLGRPSSLQRCPAHVVGRTEAILLEPLAARSAGGPAQAPALPPASTATQPHEGSLARPAGHGVFVTAAWSTHPEIIERALGVRSVSALTTKSAPTARASAAPARTVAAARTAAAAAPGAVYTGLGFDPCSAPSPAQMSAWSSSPYRAIGVYIGGTNMGCSQPNLTASWVSAETSAGWHLIPTYVGLQAPSNTCGCAPIDPKRASSEGTAAAADAIARAQAVGIEAGNPIYLDMEGYGRGGTSTSAVLGFLSAWGSRLHAGGYKSGVYSSAASGIADLVAQVGTGFTEPDDLWIADWNGSKTTSDPYVPSNDWASHRRLHQYDGGHNETYRGVTINIDGDYLDGQTAAAGPVAPRVPPGPPVTPAPAPSLKVTPSSDGTIHLYPSWTGVAAVAAWRVLAGTASSPLAPLAGSFPNASPQTSVAERSTFPYFAVQALGSAGQLLSTSKPVATPAHLALYGRTMFSASNGLGGLPAGCFTGTSCRIVTAISVGRTVIARTGSEFLPAGRGSVLYFKLSPAGRKMLAQAHGRRLATRVTARDSSGVSATSNVNLVQFSTSGRGPGRDLKPSSTIRIVGTTDFVSHGQVGGILAACFGGAPCHPTTTISVGRTIIARTGSEFLGANSLGYLSFSLTPQGHAMLASASGNQLGALVTITDGPIVASAVVALVGFR
jgi:hypothetical protein